MASQQLITKEQIIANKKQFFELLDAMAEAVEGHVEKKIKEGDGFVEAVQQLVTLPTIVFKGSKKYGPGFNAEKLSQFAKRTFGILKDVNFPIGSIYVFPTNDIIRKYNTSKKPGQEREHFTDDHLLIVCDDFGYIMLPDGNIFRVRPCGNHGCQNYSVTPYCEECYITRHPLKCASCGKPSEQKFCKNCYIHNCSHCHMTKPTKECFSRIYCLKCEQEYETNQCKKCHIFCDSNAQYGGICFLCFQKEGYTNCVTCRRPTRGKCPVCDKVVHTVKEVDDANVVVPKQIAVPIPESGPEQGVVPKYTLLKKPTTHTP